MGALAFVQPFAYELLRTVMQSITGDDEPSYWDIPEWVRRNNIIFYLPFSGGKYFALNLPHELRGIFGTGEIAASVISGKEDIEDGLSQSVSSLAGMLPIDFTGNDGSLVANLTPSLAQPLMPAYWSIYALIFGRKCLHISGGGICSGCVMASYYALRLTPSTMTLGLTAIWLITCSSPHGASS